MKLNPDCVRDILIDVEENTDVSNSIVYDLNSQMDGILSKYPIDEIAYHLEQCNLCGYLIGFQRYSGNEIEVRYLSPAGHAFLDDIRSDNVWSNTKTVAGKIGTWSLDALNKIAANIVSEIIRNHFL